MKYTVEDKNGTLHSSLSEEEILELIQQDLLLGDSKMKKAMMPAWEKVENFDFLKAALAEQAERLAEEVQGKDKKSKKDSGKVAVSAPAPNSK